MSEMSQCLCAVACHRVHTDFGKSWNVMAFKTLDFQAWKVLGKGIGPGKLQEIRYIGAGIL
jgi:hypothetical protein